MSNHRFILTSVRLSFPHLFNPQESRDGGAAKFGASFLLDKEKHAKVIEDFRSAMIRAAREKWPAGLPASVKGDKVCLREGDTKDYAGYDSNIMFVPASSITRPTIVDADKTPLVESDGRPYAGCYVNALVDIWCQDNKFGKRINCQLRGVQFVGDGEPFGERAIAPDEFPDVTEKWTPKPDTTAPDAVADQDIPF